MDITCPQCKTEYEFDDAKVTESGVTVKCTSCNFMFKVRRKAVVETEPVSAPGTVEPGPGTPKPWMIRTVTGQVFTFKELTTLQQWIVERKVNRDDHISKSGETWKRLGDIAELGSFFQVVDAAMAAESLGAAAARQAQPPPERPRGRPASQPASAGWATSQLATTDAAATPSLVGPESLGPVPAGEPAFALGTARFQPVGPSAAWEEGGSRLSGRYATADLVEDVLPRRNTGRIVGLVLIGAIVVLGVVLAIAARGKLKAVFGSRDERPSETYQAGRKLFLMDDEESLRQADLQFAHGASDDALAQAARAEVYTTWAQHLRQEAEILERRAQLGEVGALQGDDARSLRLKASTLREEAQRKLDQAEPYVKKAVAMARDKGEVNRAMADYLWLAGRAPAEVQPYLAEAQKKMPDDPEVAQVEAGLAASQGNLTRAEELHQEALTRTKARYGQSLLRAAFGLALVQLRAGRREEARAQVEIILQANPHHRLARELLTLVETEERAAASKATARTAPRDGGPPGLAPGSGSTAKPGAGGHPSPGGNAPPEVPPGASYDVLIRQGNALSENNRTMQAYKLYERALKLKPDGVEALTGIGYCRLDQEQFVAAIGFFKRALALAPTTGEAMIGMAEAYKLQENHAKALDYYRAYLQVQPGGSKASLARRNIADLERKVGTPAPAPTPGPQPPVSPEPTPSPAPSPAPAPPPPGPSSPTLPESESRPP
jgi:predicted Zn finger-like uncharacterized protein